MNPTQLTLDDLAPISSCSIHTGTHLLDEFFGNSKRIDSFDSSYSDASEIRELGQVHRSVGPDSTKYQFTNVGHKNQIFTWYVVGNIIAHVAARARGN